MKRLRQVGSLRSGAVAAALVACVVAGRSETVVLSQGLVIDNAGAYGRGPLHRDAVEAQLVSGTWAAPREGDLLRTADGEERRWRPATANENGWFSDPEHPGGYLYVRVESDIARVMLLRMLGNNLVYVNGAPRVGSRYQSRDETNSWEPSFDFVRIPIALQVGANHFLFQRTRRAGGRVKASLRTPDTNLQFNLADVTAPDLLVGRPEETVGAVVVINATTERQVGLFVSAEGPDARRAARAVPPIEPLSVRKVPFPITWSGAARDGPGPWPLTLGLARSSDGSTGVIHRGEVTLDIKDPGQPHKRTYISDIDGSVQYFVVSPAGPAPADAGPPALVLSLHGAGVKALNQALSYASKPWCTIVSPTNRRPYGFDWEDWGRADALAVLDIARSTFPCDPRRVYLTGHSMGGHGTWILGAMFPGRFAAIGPSAGWLSFGAYGGRARPAAPSAIEDLLMRADLAGDTLALVTNLASRGIYILHGAADHTVPSAQAEQVIERLATFHRDFVYHEEPGQGHWWDLSDEPGADCVDWAPMFDFFARHTLPGNREVRQVDFTTVNPGVSDTCHWVSIEDQLEPLLPSTIRIRVDPGRRRFVGTSDNVARLCLSLDTLPGSEPVNVELDGQEVDDIPCPPDTRCIRLARRRGQWRATGPADPAHKGPHRYGPFKAAFAHHMVFVYGTGGSPEENQILRDKVRFDAEQWWYQGNGSVDIIADSDFRLTDHPDRNVILYGNADSNLAWDPLLGEGPVQVRANRITIAGRTVDGDDLACLFVRPRPDSDRACVAAVSGTGPRGLRLTERLPYLYAGCNFPDCLVIGPEMLTGDPHPVRVAGIFGGDWGVDTGRFAWAEE